MSVKIVNVFIICDNATQFRKFAFLIQTQLTSVHQKLLTYSAASCHCVLRTLAFNAWQHIYLTVTDQMTSLVECSHLVLMPSLLLYILELLSKVHHLSPWQRIYVATMHTMSLSNFRNIHCGLCKPHPRSNFLAYTCHLVNYISHHLKY